MQIDDLLVIDDVHILVYKGRTLFWKATGSCMVALGRGWREGEREDLLRFEGSESTVSH